MKAGVTVAENSVVGAGAVVTITDDKEMVRVRCATTGLWSSGCHAPLL